MLTVKPLNKSVDQITIKEVKIPSQIPSGFAAPVTYKIEGNWEKLKNGLLLLSWQGKQSQWIQDHGIAMGQLYQGESEPSNQEGFEVTEVLGTFPPANLPEGEYTLKGLYLDRQTGESYPLNLTETKVAINSRIPPLSSPELDWVTQLHQQATPFSQGKIEEAMAQVSILNFYDPLKDYLKQAEEAFSWRIEQQPNQPDLLYSIALSQVIQIKSESLLETLQKTAQIDPDNVYSWTYLGFVHLYNWQPKKAEEALNIAQKFDNPPPEVHTLKIVSSLMQLNLVQFWQELKSNQ